MGDHREGAERGWTTKRGNKTSTMDIHRARFYGIDSQLLMRVAKHARGLQNGRFINIIIPAAFPPPISFVILPFASSIYLAE